MSNAAGRAPAFELRDVEVAFGDQRALDGVSLQVERGETLAFVGPSGAGKSTALGVLNGTFLPTAGAALVHGRETRELPPRAMRGVRARIGFIPQDLGLVPNLRVSQNVLAGRVGQQRALASLRSLVWPPRDELKEVLRILERLGIGDKLFQRTDALSGGERQRVAIARALYQGAETILADEPLSALDPARAKETLQLLVGVARENEITLILSMHTFELARAFVPRLVGLRHGALLFDRPTGTLEAREVERLYQLDKEA